MEFKVTYCGTSRYNVYFYGDNNEYHVTMDNLLANLEEIIPEIKDYMENHNFRNVDIVDASTGEIVANIEGIDDDVSDFDCDDDCGFNPYMGCFDFDC